MSSLNQRRPALGWLLGLGAIAIVASRFLDLNGERSFVGGSAKTSSPHLQNSRVALNGLDKKLKDRIVSTQKTSKVTDAMRLVSAAKVRRAQEGVLKARPFSTELSSMIKGVVKKLKGSGLEQEIPMLRVPEKVTNVGILMINSNRGLCGAYNTFIAKRAIERIKELNQEGIVPKIITIGKKGSVLLKTRISNSGCKFNDTGIFIDMPDTISSAQSTQVSEAVLNLFLSGEVDKVEAVYTKFKNLLSSAPALRTMLPLTPTGIEDPEDETFKVTTEDGKLKVEREKEKAVKAKNIETDVIFDQEPGVILNSMLPLYLNSQILSLLYDAQASELSSRMTAMKAATDNANDLVFTLTREFNKKRQASITQELLEINAAALAFETSENSMGRDLGLVDNEETIFTDLMQELEDGSIPEIPPEPTYADEGGVGARLFE